MKRTLVVATLLALVSLSGACANRGGTSRGVIQRTVVEDTAAPDHGDVTRPVFGQQR